MFIEKLRDTLSKLRKANNKHILICGDFMPCLLQPCVIEPTRIVHKLKPALIDNILSSFSTNS